MHTNAAAVFFRGPGVRAGATRIAGLHSAPRRFAVTRGTGHRARPAVRKIPITGWHSQSWTKKILSASPGSLTEAKVRILQKAK